MLNIEQMYKISLKDQMLITKSGRIIEPNSPLERGIVELDDRTITSLEFKNGTENKTEKVPCVYLFNLKELSRVGEKYERRPKEYWGEQLQENMKDLKKIKTTVSPYDSLEQLCTA